MLKCPKCLSEHIIRCSYTESGKQRYLCKDCMFRTVNPIGLNYSDPAINSENVNKKIKKSLRKKRWFITSAQNATPIFEKAYDSIKQWCKANDGALIVVPYRYRNPTSIFSDNDYEWWDERIVKHLVDKRVKLCNNLVLLGDIKVVPTALNPLTGIEGFTGSDSCILGHPHYQLRSVATRAGDMPKLMSTTGSITLPNYTNSKAGKVGDHHHTLGGVVVEWDGEYFHMRHVSFDNDGSFIDWDTLYKPDDVEDAPRVESITLGDLHQWWVDKDVDKATFGKIIPELRPKHVFIHDAIDSYSVSHHHRNDPFLKCAKHKHGLNNVRNEIKDLVEFLKERMDDDIKYHIVPSNHDDHITRYIKETDWRNDPENADFYLETALHMLRGTKVVQGGVSTPRPFDYWMNKYLPEVDIIPRDSSFELLGVEHGFHGDQGPNGARGSTLNLSKVGVKVTKGHSHCAEVKDGCYSVGVMAPKMAYASGPSSWTTSHVILYANGKRTHVHIINGRCRG